MRICSHKMKAVRSSVYGLSFCEHFSSTDPVLQRKDSNKSISFATQLGKICKLRLDNMNLYNGSATRSASQK